MKKSSPASSGFDRLNQVTPVSKVLAAVIFITLPFLGFWLGFNYQNNLEDMYAMCMNHSVPTMPEAKINK